MTKRKMLLRIFAGLVFLVFLTGVLPGIGRLLRKNRRLRRMYLSRPRNGRQKWVWTGGRNTGPPNRYGVVFSKSANPLYIGLMNPNHWPVNDWMTIVIFMTSSSGRMEVTNPPFPFWPSPGNFLIQKP